MLAKQITGEIDGMRAIWQRGNNSTGDAKWPRVDMTRPFDFSEPLYVAHGRPASQLASSAPPFNSCGPPFNHSTEKEALAFAAPKPIVDASSACWMKTCLLVEFDGLVDGLTGESGTRREPVTLTGGRRPIWNKIQRVTRFDAHHDVGASL